MKALSNLKPAINQSSLFGIIALIALVPVILPHYALAAELQTEGKQTQVFEIKIADSELENLTPKTNEESSSLTIRELQTNDPLVIALTQYLNNHNSPLAEYASEMVKEPQWQRALAISYVESHMGRYCHSNNCSGIGGAPGMKSWRKYSNKLEWFKDMSQLMEKPLYKERYTTFKKMKGVYVQPGSNAWVYGAQQKYDQLMAITRQAEIDKQALAKSYSQAIIALATFPETSN